METNATKYSTHASDPPNFNHGPDTFLHRHFGDDGKELVDWERYDDDRPLYPLRSLEHIIQYHRDHAQPLGDSTGAFQHVVDVGCGPGTLLPTFIANHFQRATLIDLHATQLAVAKRRFEFLVQNKAPSQLPLQTLNTLQCPGEDMPLEDESADLVISAEAVQWMNWRKFLAEAYRVLKRGGTLAVLFYVPVMRFVDAEVDALMTQLSNYLVDIGGHERRKAPLPDSCKRLIASSFDELDLQNAGFIHEQRDKYDEWPDFQHRHASDWQDNHSGTSISHDKAYFMQKLIPDTAILMRSLRSLAYWDEGLDADAKSANPRVPLFMESIEAILRRRGQPLVAYLPYFEILGSKP